MAYPTTYEPSSNSQINGLTFGPTSSGGPNPGGFGSGQIGTGVAADYQGGTPYSDTSDAGYAGYAAGITAVGSIIQGQMETQAFKAKLEAETDAAITNAGNAVTSYELQMAQSQEMIENINHVLGDKLSERGLTAIKEASLMKVASVESGTSGGTTEMAVKEAFINENFDKANIVSAGRDKLRNIYATMETSKLSTEHSIDSILLGGTRVDTNPLLAGVAGGIGSFNQFLGMLPQSERASAFGISSDYQRRT